MFFIFSSFKEKRFIVHLSILLCFRAWLNWLNKETRKKWVKCPIPKKKNKVNKKMLKITKIETKAKAFKEKRAFFISKRRNNNN